MTTCYIIRHAEKEQGDYYDPRLRHQDQPLSPQGRLDAEKLISFISVKPISAIYVSAYRRTRQTIEPVARQLQLTPVADDRLNEIDNGRLEGMTDQEIQQTYPDVWKAYAERTADFRFPDGETGAEAQQRIMDFIEEKWRLHDAENIILVSHDGLIRILMCSILNIPVYKRWNFHVDTCGITEIAFQREFAAWKLIRFNQSC